MSTSGAGVPKAHLTAAVGVPICGYDVTVVTVARFLTGDTIEDFANCGQVTYAALHHLLDVFWSAGRSSYCGPGAT